MNAKISRTERLNGDFRKEIYEIITRKLNNPLIQCMVSVLRVETSKDLKYAKVFISIYAKNEQEKQTTFEAIKDEAKRIRYELAHRTRTRTVPELHFVLDGTIEYGDKMNKLLTNIVKNDEGEN